MGGRKSSSHIIQFTFICVLELMTISHMVTNGFEVDMQTNIPVRYDEAQLWRIYNITKNFDNNGEFELLQRLEKEFDAKIWHHNAQYMDISVKRTHLETAKLFLKQNNLQLEILNSNIQNLFENEAKYEKYTNSTKEKRATSEGTGMDWRKYHNLKTIYNYMFDIARQNSDICTMFNIGQTANRRRLLVLRISENTTNPAIWLDGGMHGREWITPASMTFIIKQLIINWHQHDRHIRNKTWLIMPVMNPDGYVYSHEVDRLWSKNRSPNANSNCTGVDLNRNFEIGWGGKGSSANPCSDIYHGIVPDSELETRAVKNFLIRHKCNLAAYLTYHSYGQAILYPWSYKEAAVENSSKLQRVAELANKLIERRTSRYYQIQISNVNFGVRGGESSDWARAILDVEYVFTMALRDRGRFGFILPEEQILPTAHEAYAFAITVAKAF